MMKNKIEYTRLRQKYDVGTTLWPESHFQCLKYIEYYENKYGRKVWFPDSEKTMGNFHGMVEDISTKENEIKREPFYYYLKYFNKIMEFPWLYLHSDPWPDLIIDDIYFSFTNSWYGHSTVHVFAFDFMKSLETYSFRDSKGALEEKVYFCNGIVVREDGCYKHLTRAFIHADDQRFGKKRLAPSHYSNAATNVITEKWEHGLSIRIPTYYEIKNDVTTQDKIIRGIIKRAGFPNESALITDDQRRAIKPGSNFAHNIFNPASEYSIYKEKLESIYRTIIDLGLS